MGLHAGFRYAALVAAGALLSLLATGCVVEKKGANGNEDVKIGTPLGGLHVKTNQNVVAANIGLPIYPGAVPEKKNTGSDDSNAADVNMSFGNFHLRVNAMSYETTDAPDKVQAFYENAMGQYGDVLQCQGKKALGTVTRTHQGLTCNEDGGNNVKMNTDVDGSKVELKAGSKQHQHIVAIDPKGTGTKFGLVELELPSGDWLNDKETN